MANPKKRRKLFVFCAIGIVLIALTLMAVFKKKEVFITVQTEKVARRNLTEIVVANGRIQPVLQVKISPEVSGEIIALPVKEGQQVQKGDLILKIKPDFYIANRNQAEASYKSSLAGKTTAEATLEKNEAEFKRNEELFRRKLISDSAFIEVKTARDIAAAQLVSSTHQVEMSKAQWARAEDDLTKTTIVSPLSGTITKLNSQLGERVVGTATMAGTEVMTVSDLNEMEARVDIGEMDVVLIGRGQNVRLEVDAFKDRKFSGTVTEIANSSKGLNAPGGGGSSSSQDATKFEVRIRVKEKEIFRPGMSVTAEIETRYRTNVLTVPLASVTTRYPKKPDEKSAASADSAKTNSVPPNTNSETARADKKSKESKQVEVVFLLEGDHVKAAPVKIGISDDSRWEITEGLNEGDEIVSGGFRAISRDLEDGKKVKKGPAVSDKDKKDS